MRQDIPPYSVEYEREGEAPQRCGPTCSSHADALIMMHELSLHPDVQHVCIKDGTGQVVTAGWR